jgi:hypothetical protein
MYGEAIAVKGVDKEFRKFEDKFDHHRWRWRLEIVGMVFNSV